MRSNLETATLNMQVDLRIGEDAPMTGEPDDLEEVQRRLQDIQRRKRGRIRWQIGKHTAELAIGAIEGREKRDRPHGKARRRKRRKRLL
jgi:hypothetical protein